MPGEKLKIAIENVNYEMFLQMLKYIYTDTCDVLTINARFHIGGDLDSPSECTSDGSQSPRDIDIPVPVYEVSSGRQQSAFEVYQTQGKKKKGKKGGAGGGGGGKKEGGSGRDGEKKPQSQQGQGHSQNPVQNMKDLTKRFGVRNLAKR